MKRDDLHKRALVLTRMSKNSEGKRVKQDGQVINLGRATFAPTYTSPNVRFQVSVAEFKAFSKSALVGFLQERKIAPLISLAVEHYGNTAAALVEGDEIHLLQFFQHLIRCLAARLHAGRKCACLLLASGPA